MLKSEMTWMSVLTNLNVCGRNKSKESSLTFSKIISLLEWKHRRLEDQLNHVRIRTGPHPGA